MAMVEVARFLDLTEAEVVASALRSSGMFVFVQNEVIARMRFSLCNAVGGLRIWVPEADAADAMAFIAANRRQSSTLAPLPAPEATVRVVLSLLLTWLFGMVVPLRPRRPERLGDEQPAE